jgi:glycosyltransferase involved in cell wall biosynthesis
MRILVIAPQPFYQERGTPIATRLLVEALQSAGHEVDVLTYHVGDDPRLAGVRVFRAPAVPFVRDVPIGFSVRKLLCDVALGLKLLTLTRRHRYDVLHAVEEAVFLSLLVRAVGAGRGRSVGPNLERLGCRVVYDMDSSLPEQLLGKYRSLRRLDGVLRRLERLAVARSDLVLAVCEDLAARVRAYATATPVDVVEDVSLLGDDAAGAVEDLRAGLPADGALVLYVGNLEHYQGVDLLLDAVAALRVTEPLKVVAIGGGPAAVAAYRARAAELGIGATVTFVGARPLRDLGAYLTQADVLVSPRCSGHNTPMKLYSYLAAGKAVLATRIRSHTQVLTDDCALLVEPQSQALAQGLETLLRSPALREQLGLAARRLATTRYSITQFRESVASAYRRLAIAPTGNA